MNHLGIAPSTEMFARSFYTHLHEALLTDLNQEAQDDETGLPGEYLTLGTQQEAPSFRTNSIIQQNNRLLVCCHLLGHWIPGIKHSCYERIKHHAEFCCPIQVPEQNIAHMNIGLPFQ